MVGNSGLMLQTEKQLSDGEEIDPKLVKTFTSRLLAAKRSNYGKHPVVIVTPIYKSQALLTVYNNLKNQGEFTDWAGEYYDERKDTGVFVLALMPPNKEDVLGN